METRFVPSIGKWCLFLYGCLVRTFESKAEAIAYITNYR